MPEFTFNPKLATGGFQVFPKAAYEFVIGEPKAFHSPANEALDKKENYGVRYTLTVAEGEMKGKKYIKNCYQHSQGARDFSKQFQIAAAGLDPKNGGDEEFNSRYGDMDWGFNSDTNRVGEGWRMLEGKRVVGEMDVKINDSTGDKQQAEKGWRPVG